MVMAAVVMIVSSLGKMGNVRDTSAHLVSARPNRNLVLVLFYHTIQYSPMTYINQAYAPLFRELSERLSSVLAGEARQMKCSTP